jgi:hypothetical protein
VTKEECSRLVGILKVLSTTFTWEINYTDWDSYLVKLDDLEFDEVKDVFLHYSRNSIRFPDPIAVRNTVLFERKMRLVGLAAQ